MPITLKKDVWKVKDPSSGQYRGAAILSTTLPQDAAQIISESNTTIQNIKDMAIDAVDTALNDESTGLIPKAEADRDAIDDSLNNATNGIIPTAQSDRDDIDDSLNNINDGIIPEAQANLATIAAAVQSQISQGTDKTLSVAKGFADAKAAGMLVKVSNYQPGSALDDPATSQDASQNTGYPVYKDSNRVWVKETYAELEVPTMDDHNELKSAISGLATNGTVNTPVTLVKNNGYEYNSYGQPVSNAYYWASDTFAVLAGDVVHADVMGNGSAAIQFYPTGWPDVGTLSEVKLVTDQYDYSLSIPKDGTARVCCRTSYDGKATIERKAPIVADLEEAISDNAEEIANINADICGENVFELNGSLSSKASSLVPIFKRYGTAYDTEDNTYATDVPMYKDFKDMGKQALIIAPATKNLLSEAGSKSLTSAETISVTAGDYTLSLQGTTGYVTYSNGDNSLTGVVKQGESAHFTFSANDTLTITPSSNADYVQFEKNIAKTPWNLGGKNRYDATLKFDTSALNFDEFGIGFTFKPFDDCQYCKNNYMMLAYGRKDSNSYFVISWRTANTTTNYHFELRYIVGGTAFSIQSPWGGWEVQDGGLVTGDKVTFKAGQKIAIYAHIIPSREIALYYMIDGVVSVSNYYGSIGRMNTVGTIHIGAGSTTSTSDPSQIADAMFSDVRIDTENPNPMEFFKGVA